MKLFEYEGKSVTVTCIDGQIVNGLADDYCSDLDNENGKVSINIDSITIYENEISNIEISGGVLPKTPNKVFGEMFFDTGWETQSEINLWGKSYSIKVRANAYYEEDEITAEQEASYLSFKDKQIEKLHLVETLLLQYAVNLSSEQLNTRFTPKTLIIWDNGNYALLFSDTNDSDNGIAVILYPTEEIMSQDEYLTYNY